MLEDILLLENVGPIILCLLAGPFSDRWDCLITSFDTLADLRRYSFFKIYFVRRYGRKLPLLLSCLGMSLTYAGYGVLVTIDPTHK